ncbi:IS4 family transposase [Desulfosarcina ovata subsp. sediminis]|uniref:IS4 family transposase n=1 Tax=Desulfosarcina ovata subsp. sediminis TaxID=885957 RepID=A0A5K7ZFE0_9BACT|nr:IS1634 family transposase [Desulfosarcina ovata]BBO80792.1 IS4 family transposase [Desulfosarcina ovata subsp. sediminis]
MEKLVPEDLTFSEVGHLPIIKDFAKKIELVETLDAMVDSKMELSPGIAVMAMVLDTLSGRTPLYRLEEFFQEKDIELILGHDVEPELFCDYNVGRVLDKIFDTGTQKVFSQIAQNAISIFDVDPRRLHFDTTSISVFGDYDFTDPPLKITYGHSKDKRPDLKQFMISMLCVDRNIPILGTTEDGNASDKTLNNELLGGVSKHMARHGLKAGAFVYVADSAFVTPDNLEIAKDKNVKFLTRLPATYKECGRAISDAVCADNWIELGKLNETPATKKRPAADYRGFETTVELYEKTYRALVVHSSAHDKRRHKRIDRLLGKKRKDLETHCKKINAGPFYCRPDAEAAAEKIVKTAANSYHRIQYGIKEVAKYRRGRPAKGKARTPIGYEYHLDVEINVDADAVAPLRLEVGCFVLLSNLSSKQERVQWTIVTLLELYKNQSGIEQNFGFLKDPVIVNSIFLKKPKRIEVLGLVLLIALLIWRLMERSMRQHLEKTESKITGWKNRPTKRPTSFMMTTKFLSILVARSGNRRQLVKPFKPVQLEFLQAVGCRNQRWPNGLNFHNY